jgi:LuxR family transcriptional regulator, maltose regulon positive regulatory protein
VREPQNEQSLGIGVSESTDDDRLAMRALEELPGVAVVVFDRALRVRLAGGDALAAGTDGPDALVGRRVRDVLPAEVALAATPHCRSALAGRESTCAVRSPDGKRAFVVQTKPLRAESDEVIAGLAIARDVSPTAADVVPAGGSEGLRFRAPELRAEAVPRRALLVRVETTDAPVVLMTAPAGSGKTTAAAQIAAAGPCCAWIPLEKRHNDPAVLTDTLLAATASFDGREPPGAGSADADGLEAVTEALRTCPARFVLVLDDAHQLHSRAALDIVAGAMRSVPSGSRLVIASRTELDLHHGSLVAGRALLHLRAPDLAMSAAECAALATGAGMEIPARDVEELARRADGWPAGVSLLAAALAERGAGASLGDVGGWEASIAAYLAEEVLHRQPEDVRRFLLESSVIEKLSGPACDAVLERSDSGRILRRLARGNVPMATVDERGPQYRLNPLLREMLTQELRGSDPSAVTRLHLRASDWFEQHGDMEQAIHHAREAGAIDRAAELVGRALPDYVLSRTRRIADLVGEFPAAELRREHHLALARGWDAVCSGSAEATTYWVAAAEGALTRLDARARDSATGPLALLRAAAAVGGVSDMADEAEHANRTEAPGSAWRPLACYLEGAAAELLGDRGRARTRLREAEQLASIGAPMLRPLILAQLSQVASDDDDAEGSRELAASADAVIYEHGLEDAAGGAIVEALSALDLAKDGHEAKARDRMDRASAKLAKPGWMPSWRRAQTQIVLAQAHLQLGDAPAARRLERMARRAIQEGAQDATVLRRRLTSLKATLDAFPAVSISGSGHLTTAELRVLRYLPTHLSFRQIGERLYLSRHTVKTEAISAYRKLGVNSRADAVRKAQELGILE